MEYTFKLKGDWVIVDSDEETSVLENFSDSGWTPAKAKEIIDGVQNSLDTGEKYEWANEDVHLVALSDGVYFYDLLARRAGMKKGNQDLDLSHQEFIDFLTAFKQFIENNQ